ncbi:MAG: hypothetical protein RL385_844 [Pseudomonadota bacterium]
MSLRPTRFLPAAALLAIACSPESTDDGISATISGNPGGNSAIGSPYDGGVATYDAGRPTLPVITSPVALTDGGGDNCLVQPIDTHGEAPDMLIVMDKSGSMAIAGRWEPSKAAVKKLTEQYQTTVRFGLTTYPGGDLGGAIGGALGGAGGLIGGIMIGGGGGPGGITGVGCDGGKLDVPVAENAAPQIGQFLDSTAPNGGTPTAAALEAALGYLGPRMEAGPDFKGSRPGSVLLVTDGEPTCGTDPGGETAAAAAKLRAAGIKVYVVGYQVQAADLMNRIAMSGGTDHYYPVENGQQLEAAFNDITKDVVRCDFELLTSDTKPDPNFIYVTIDGMQRKLGEADGWSIEGKHITLQGQACTGLKDGKLHTVKAEQRCEVVR